MELCRQAAGHCELSMGKAAADLADGGGSSRFHQCLPGSLTQVCNLDVKLNPGRNRTVRRHLMLLFAIKPFFTFRISVLSREKLENVSLYTPVLANGMDLPSKNSARPGRSWNLTFHQRQNK